MRLTKVIICGYRSFKSETTVELDNRITVLLGANDHGKTNFLSALTHLNVENAFEYDADLNWDEETASDSFPRIRYFLKPEASEQASLREDFLRKQRFDFISEKVEAITEEMRSISDEMKRLRQIIENESGRDDATESKPEGDVRQDFGPIEEKLAELREETVVKNSIRDKWRSLREVVLRSEGELENVSITALLQQLKSEAASLQSQLNEATASRADQEKALAAAKEEGDKIKISAAESSLKKAQAVQVRVKPMVESVDTSVRLLELHQKFYEDSSDKEYPRMMQLVSKITSKCPDTFILERKGVGSALVLLENEISAPLPEYLDVRLPRVEIFSSVDQLPDGVSQETVWKPESRFMRGIFYYSGLERSEWPQVFFQGDQTSKRLADASGKLNEVLRRDWRQGKELTFKLEHRGSDRIDLVIEDPKVRSRYVRISKRSSGFTHFFGLKTILHSSEVESDAASHIWLFDEPGISLHPDGQHDLLQALDTISRQNQVVYTTHSLFMIDKNYPARHRLIAKAESGTKVDGKPYIGNWRAAIDALGLALPGTILFATHVLLVEGPSDAIILNALLQTLAEMGLHDLDINPLSVMPTGDPKEAVAIARILLDANVKPKVAALYDGDEGGKRRKAKLDRVLENDAHVVLTANRTIEDFILGFDELFVPAAAAYSARVFEVDEQEVRAAIVEALKNVPSEKKRVDVVLEAIVAKAKLDEPPSKVGIARDYTYALLGNCDLKFSKAELTALKKLVEQINSALKLPSRTTGQEQILQ